ncbi:hypothetical protein [Lentzea sp. NPDC060358]
MGSADASAETEVIPMKKIAIRKTGSIKLTTSAPGYCTPCC